MLSFILQVPRLPCLFEQLAPAKTASATAVLHNIVDISTSPFDVNGSTNLVKTNENKTNPRQRRKKNRTVELSSGNHASNREDFPLVYRSFDTSKGFLPLPGEYENITRDKNIFKLSAYLKDIKKPDGLQQQQRQKKDRNKSIDMTNDIDKNQYNKNGQINNKFSLFRYDFMFNIIIHIKKYI